MEVNRSTVEAAPGSATKRAPRSGLRRRRLLSAWLFMLPLILVNVLVILGPSIATVYYSFTEWSGIGPAEWVGLQNYRDIVADADFWAALGHNLIWTLIFLTVPIAMGLLGAFLLSQITRFQMVFRVLYFVPYVMASVVNAALWQNILDPDRGIGASLAAVGIPFLEGVSFFGNERLALPAVAFVDNWHWWGFVVLLFLTALQSVDAELYEAAKIDGANRWQQFINVTIPGIRATLVFVVLITIIGSLLVFDYIYIITQGGPAGASEVVGTLMYKEAFARFEAGYAAALALGMSFMSGLIVLGFIVLRRRGWEI
ncbi:MAG TPA: sugar ABC transporter permease [Rubrobacter sp.]|nr:sugar ABC transporter permease [Rubrobacter sp.]